MIITYGIIFLLLLALELVYFKIADKFNIIDKPNERASHSTIVLRGGGILFPIAALMWMVLAGFNGFHEAIELQMYLPFVIGMMIVTGLSFIDDVVSVRNRIRLMVQFVSYCLMFWSLGVHALFDNNCWITVSGIALLALIVCVGATNIYNFMDGINGITAGYSLAILVPLIALNHNLGFVAESLLTVITIAVVVFSLFNFRPKGKAKCFAGDVGSIGIAFVLMFCIGRLIMQTHDITWLILMIVYGVDGLLTIFHRILLHENLGKAHRKHVYQLMCNELKIGHVKVTLIYMTLQLMISLGFIYICPNNLVCHWIFFVVTIIVLAIAYVAFKKKYYHLHEEYLANLTT